MVRPLAVQDKCPLRFAKQTLNRVATDDRSADRVEIAMHIGWPLLPLSWQSRCRSAVAKAAIRCGCQNLVQQNSWPAGKLLRRLSAHMAPSGLQKYVRTTFFGKATLGLFFQVTLSLRPQIGDTLIRCAVRKTLAFRSLNKNYSRHVKPLGSSSLHFRNSSRNPSAVPPNSVMEY